MSVASAWGRRATYSHFFAVLVPLVLTPLLSNRQVAKADDDHSSLQTTRQDKDQTRPSSLSDLSPISPIRIFRPNPNVEIAFDVRTRTPLYVLQRLNHRPSNNNNNNNNNRRRRHHFYEEASLAERFRSRNSHYHLTGYDRGHLGAAADFFHDPAADEQQSYNLTNVAPQHADLNRKLWAQLEEWTRTVAAAHQSPQENNNDKDDVETYAITGPLWLPSRQTDQARFEYNYPGLGVPPSLVVVPTHFFKLVVVVVVVDSSTTHGNNRGRRRRTISKFACFVIPNNDSSNNRHLQDYVVRWTDLEAVSGLVFFPTLASEECKAAADRATDQLLSGAAAKTLQQPPLLLTDGTQHILFASSRGGNNKKKLRAVAAMSHLCHEHFSCVPPYNRAAKVLAQDRRT